MTEPVHVLKILPTFFEAIERGDKRFEIRKNHDRGFQRGDVVHLQEYDPQKGLTSAAHYTGRELLCRITYVSDYDQPPNQVVFGFTVLDDAPNQVE